MSKSKLNSITSTYYNIIDSSFITYFIRNWPREKYLYLANLLIIKKTVQIKQLKKKIMWY